MSRPDLLRELRAARPSAPGELRRRVELIVAQAPPPRRQPAWRRVVLAAALVAAAVIAAAVLVPRGGKQTVAPLPYEQQAAAPAAVGKAAASDSARTALPAPTLRRLQRYSASLSLRVQNAVAVSDAAKQAVALAQALQGYTQSIDVSAGGRTGYAAIVLRIPRTSVADAVRRLSALGTILSERVAVTDLQAQANTTDRLIARLQRQLALLRARPQTAETLRRIDALTARVQRLQRRKAATVREGRYATVSVQLTTREPAAVPHRGHGPLHGLGVAFRWLGIGALYALALGAPLAIVALLAWLGARAIRRRREDRLLSA